MSCGVGRRHGSDLALPRLWCKPSAAAPIQPLAWERTCAAGAALKRKTNKQKKQKRTVPLETCPPPLLGGDSDPLQLCPPAHHSISLLPRENRASAQHKTLEARNTLNMWKKAYFDIRAKIEASGREARWEFDRKRLFERTDYMATICQDLYEVLQVGSLGCAFISACAGGQSWDLHGGRQFGFLMVGLQAPCQVRIREGLAGETPARANRVPEHTSPWSLSLELCDIPPSPPAFVFN